MMERLTRKNDGGDYYYPKCFEKCNGLEASSKCDNCEITTSVCEKLGKYEDLEEQGLLLRLPCKVGDAIYVNGVNGVGEAEKCKVIRVDYHSSFTTKRSDIEALLVSDPKNSIGFYDKEIGKTVFLTQAEAEQKLKEMENR